MFFFFASGHQGFVLQPPLGLEWPRGRASRVEGTLASWAWKVNRAGCWASSAYAQEEARAHIHVHVGTSNAGAVVVVFYFPPCALMRQTARLTNDGYHLLAYFSFFFFFHACGDGNIGVWLLGCRG